MCIRDRFKNVRTRNTEKNFGKNLGSEKNNDGSWEMPLTCVKTHRNYIHVEEINEKLLTISDRTLLKEIRKSITRLQIMRLLCKCKPT